MTPRPDVRHWGAFAAIAVAFVVVVVFVWRSAVLAPALPADPALMTDDQFRSHAQRVYAQHELRRLDELTAADEIRSTLAPLVSAPSREQDVAYLVGFVSEFLWYRYCQDDVEAYKRWRRDRGYVLKDPEVLASAMMIAADHESQFGEAYPGHDRIEETFYRFWATGFDFRDGSGRVTVGSGRVTAIAATPEAISVAFGSVTRENPGSQPSLGGELGELWAGRSQGTLRNWWEPAGGTRHEALQRWSTVDVALVGVLMEYATGDRRPTVYGFWRDPGDGRWRHAWISNNNTDGRISGTEY